METASPITPASNTTDPRNIVSLLIATKRVEADATKARVALEEELVAAIDKREVNEEGSKTYTIGEYKVAVKRSLNRKIDKIDNIKVVFEANSFDAALAPIEYKPSLSDKGLKWLADNRKDIYSKLSPHLTVTPAKVGVTVEMTL